MDESLTTQDQAGQPPRSPGLDGRPAEVQVPMFPIASAQRAVQNVELFVGAGGLALGLATAGFVASHLFEKNRWCGETLKVNKDAGVGVNGVVNLSDVRDVSWSSIAGPVRLLAAGPPCQPFSLAGSHKGDRDHRNEFPATLKAVRELRPAVVLIENVQGLARPSFRQYFDYILRQLAFPSLGPVSDEEEWLDHLARLDGHARCATPEYAVRWKVLNAADYGVAQLRTRTVIIATRADLPTVELPPRTHSRAALLADQKSGAYWKRHGISPPAELVVPKGGGSSGDGDEGLLPWRTVRDALADLRDPSHAADDPLQHWVIPGARVYRGHLGSIQDWPSKTIKAGVHGVAGGENILHLDDGSFRYYTLREMAKIQGFPDHYVFKGPRSRIIGQIGNAVPCGLAEALGSAISKMFEEHSTPSTRRNTKPDHARPTRDQATATKSQGARLAHGI